MPDRVVKTTLIIDSTGGVRAVRGLGDESQRTEGKLSHLDRGVRGLGKSFGGLKGAIGGGLGALGIGGLAFGLESIISRTKEVAQETERFSAVTGIGATASLRYTQALKARGLSGETVTKAFGFLAKNLRSAELQEGKYVLSQTKAIAKGKESTAVLGRQATAFKELGINLAQFNALSEEDKLKEVTKRFEALPDGMKKTRLELELFGKGGKQLAPVLDKNNLSLNKQYELTKKFYPTLKGGSAGLRELNEKTAESKMAFEGFEFTLGVALIPTLTKVMGTFSELVVEVEKGKGVFGELEHTFEGIGKFAGGAFGYIKEIASSLGVKLGGDTLGAVLAAAGIAHAGKKVSKLASPIVKAGKFAASHPELAPLAVGAATPFVGAADIHAGVEALSPGYLKQHSLGEVEGAIAGRVPHGGAGRGHETLSGKAARGGETPSEAALLVKAIESLKPGASEQAVQVNIDGARVAELLLGNPRARRHLAEAVTIYSHSMAARGPHG